MPHSGLQARLKTMFNPVHKIESGLSVSEHTPTEGVKTVACRLNNARVEEMPDTVVGSAEVCVHTCTTTAAKRAQ